MGSSVHCKQYLSQAERAGAALLAQLIADGRLRAALAALRGAFFMLAPAMQGFAHALLARLERARLARSQAPPGSNAGLGSGSGSAEPPAAAVLGVSAADVQELLDDALAEGCRDCSPGSADESRLRAGDAEDIRGLKLSVSGAPTLVLAFYAVAVDLNL